MKINKIKLTQMLFFISFIYLTLLIPILITIYSSSWYEYNYNKQEITSTININLTINATSNLISFFKFRTNLNDLWNEKEKIHIREVREIYLKIIIIGVIFLILFSILFNTKTLLYYSKINIYIILSLFILIPFFTIIFSGIFHTMLFDNTYWIIDQNDISYYLFPNSFFKNSFLLILIISLLENTFIYILLKKNKLE